MIVLAAMTLAVLSSAPAFGQTEAPSRWQLKTSLVLVDTDSPFAIDKPSGGQVHAGGNAEIGASISLEYFWSDQIGLEFGVAYAKSPDVDDNVDGNNNSIGEGPGFLPVFVGVNIHPIESENFDVYLGPRAAYVTFGDFDLDVEGQQTRFEVDNEFAWGLAAGWNYRFRDSHWSLVAEAT